MDEEIKQLLQTNLELAEKTLKVVKKLHRAHVYRTTVTAVKWLVIIGLLIFGFRQIQPYLNQLNEAYQSALRVLQQVNQFLPKK